VEQSDKPSVDKLTPKQRKFVEAFTGNATEAARIAGYQGDDNTLGVTGYDLLRNPKIFQAIADRFPRGAPAVLDSSDERSGGRDEGPA
jgi:hypothetical protein